MRWEGTDRTVDVVLASTADEIQAENERLRASLDQIANNDNVEASKRIAQEALR